MKTAAKRRCPEGSVPVQVNVPIPVHRTIKSAAAKKGGKLHEEIVQVLTNYAENLVSREA